MRRANLAVLWVVASCAASPPEASVAVEEPLPLPPIPKAVVHKAPTPTVLLAQADTPVPSVAALSPPQIVVASEQARTDANNYVAWKNSKPENIDRLSQLTVHVANSVAKMKAGEHNGKYPATDVIAARAALRDLRSFLANKGD